MGSSEFLISEYIPALVCAIQIVHSGTIMWSYHEKNPVNINVDYEGVAGRLRGWNAEAVDGGSHGDMFLQKISSADECGPFQSGLVWMNDILCHCAPHAQMVPAGAVAALQTAQSAIQQTEKGEYNPANYKLPEWVSGQDLAAFIEQCNTIARKADGDFKAAQAAEAEAQQPAKEEAQPSSTGTGDHPVAPVEIITNISATSSNFYKFNVDMD